MATILPEFIYVYLRGQCLHEGCPCPEFSGWDPITCRLRNHPLHPEDPCGCKHLASGHAELPTEARVPLSALGTFYRTAPSSMPGSSAPNQPLLNQPFAPPHRTHASSTLGILSASDDAAPPIDQNPFARPTSRVGSALQNREASRLNLPHHQPPHRTLPNPASRVVTAARAPRSSGDRARRRNTTALDVSGIASTMDARALPVALTQPEGFVCVIYWIPFSPEHQMSERTTPIFAWLNDDFDAVVGTLEGANLSIRVTLPIGEQSFFDELNDLAVQHLRGCGIVIPERPDDDDAPVADNSYGRRLFHLVRLSGEAAQPRRLRRCPQIYAKDFTQAGLKAAYKGMRSPREGQILMLAPRYGHLRGPIELGGPLHDCYPWRVLSAFIPQDERGCIAGVCPSQPDTMDTSDDSVPSAPARARPNAAGPSPPSRATSPSAPQSSQAARSPSPTFSLRTLSPSPDFPSPQTLIASLPGSQNIAPAAPLRHRSLSDTAPAELQPAAQRRRLAGPSAAPINDDDDIMVVEHSPAASEIIDLTADEDERELTLPFHTVAGMAIAVRQKATSRRSVYIDGPTEDLVAKAMVALIVEKTFIFNKPRLAIPSQVSCDHPPYPLPAFLLPSRIIFVGPASGPGAERVPLRKALEQLCQNTAQENYWSVLGRWRVPYMPPYPYLGSEREKDRTNRHRAAGAAAALVLINNLEPAADISPFWLALIILGRSAIDSLRVNVVDYLEPGAEDGLRAWLSLRHSDIIEDRHHPAAELAFNVLDMPIDASLRQKRDEVRHNEMRASIIAQTLFRHPAPWSTAKYQDFRAGFNFTLSRSHTVIEHLRLNDDHKIIPFLTTLYNLELSSPGQILDIIEWRVDDRDRKSTDSILFHNVVRARLMHWIERKGVPDPTAAMRGGFDGVTAAPQGLDAADPMFRPKLFLQAITASTLRPVSSPREIKVSISRLARPDIRLDMQGAVLEIHTCDREVVVAITPWLERVLVEPIPSPGEDSVFDAWLYQQLYICVVGFSAN